MEYIKECGWKSVAQCWYTREVCVAHNGHPDKIAKTLGSTLSREKISIQRESLDCSTCMQVVAEYIVVWNTLNSTMMVSTWINILLALRGVNWSNMFFAMVSSCGSPDDVISCVEAQHYPQVTHLCAEEHKLEDMWEIREELKRIPSQRSLSAAISQSVIEPTIAIYFQDSSK